MVKKFKPDKKPVIPKVFRLTVYKRLTPKNKEGHIKAFLKAVVLNA